MQQGEYAEYVASLLGTLVPGILWSWLLLSCIGLGYALRLWHRALGDVHRQRSQPANTILAYVATGNLRRVWIRVLMFAGFLVIGLCAVGLQLVPAGLARELARFLYVLLFLVVNALVTYNSYKDEQHDRILQLLIRERLVHHESS